MKRRDESIAHSTFNFKRTFNIRKNAPAHQKFRRSLTSLFFSALLLLTALLQSVFFEVGSASAENGLSAGSQARVANTDGDGLRLRAEPDAGAGTMQILGENWLVTIKGGPFNDKQGNSFYKVEWSNRTGYAMTQYLVYAGKNSASSGGSPKVAIGGQARVAGTGGDGVRMRQQPNTAASSLTILSENYLVTVLGGPFNDNQGNSFYKIEWTGYTGYVSGSFLTNAPKNAVAGKGGSMRITNTDGDPIRFRTSPDRGSDTNGYVYEGQVLKLLAGPFKDNAGNSWYKLERNGEVGYVDGSYLRRTDQATTTVTTAPAKPAAPSAPAPKPQPIPAPPSNGSLGERISSYVMQFVGWRYVWGSSNPAAGGFDCSGLVYWVLTQNGLGGVGHSVDDDLLIGAPVPRDQLQPGDVVIFANTYKSGPSHSGIYIGGGRFVHAETYSTGVTINNMSDSYYASRYYAARRPGV